MFCSKCGTQIEEGSSFCQKCGAPASQPVAQAMPGQPAAAVKTNGFAVASLVCGIVGFFVNPLSILAIIFAGVALSQIGKNPGVKGKGMAVAGLVLGILFFILWIIVIAIIGSSLWWINGFGGY